MKYLFLLVLAVVAFSCENEENMTIDAPEVNFNVKMQ
jgi:hypothetical protein